LVPCCDTFFHDVDTTVCQQLQSAFFLEWISLKAVTHPSTDCPDVAALLYSK
jgi:hypothetical protein